MISTNDMRPGQTLDLDGELYSIIKYEHHKPGKGGAMVRTKLKSIKNGAVVERTFRADEKVNLARLDKREMQYLYSDETGYIFMDNETFDQITIEKDFLGDMAGFLKEEQVVVVQLYQGTPIGIDLPPTVELVVTETDPGDCRDWRNRHGAALPAAGRDHSGRHPHRRIRHAGQITLSLKG
jgi:elongation factor P